jgi:hypothetical protein
LHGRLDRVTEGKYRTFREFYPFYLSEHRNPTSRKLHFVGTSMVVALLLVAAVALTWWLVPVALVQAYSFAWVGHFFFEHNRPATFRYPGYSFIADCRMWWELLTGKLGFRGER